MAYDPGYGPNCGDACCGGPSCGGNCCPTGLGCCDIFFRAEYLMWWSNGGATPPLVTRSFGGTAQANAGVLGRPGTSILFGGDDLDSDLRSGVLVGVGGWCNPQRSFGWEVNYLYLGEDNQDYFADNATSGILARPFFNTQTGAQDSRLINYPGLVSGSVGVDATTEFQSIEAIVRSCCFESCYGRTDFILGYRYANLTERIRIEESTLALSGVIAGTTIDIFDQFETLSEFNGVNLGFITTGRLNPCWSYEFTAKIALGATSSSGTIRGERTTTNNLGSSTVEGGLLALDTNIGDYSQTNFGVMPEVGIKLRYDLNPCWSATVGYSVRAVSGVMRASEQIDTTINPTQIAPGTFTGVSRPDFPFEDSTFIAHGLNFGLQLSF